MRAMERRHGLSGADGGKWSRGLFVDIFPDVRDDWGILDGVAVGHIIPGALVWCGQRACRGQATGVRDHDGAVFWLLSRDIGHLAREGTQGARE
jgi:hypothetical protein